jgi:hypothetical protein
MRCGWKLMMILIGKLNLIVPNKKVDSSSGIMAGRKD